MKVADLFCGCGGMSEGLKQAGIKVTFAIDNWKVALATHAANHDCEHSEADIGTLDPATLGRFDIVIGSPPCPDFSVANSKRDPQRGLVLVEAFLRIVRATKAKWWVFENVPPIRPYLNRFAIPRITILNAADYGTPQSRNRVFAGNYIIPRPTHAEAARFALDGRPLKPWVSVRDALGIEGTLGQPVRSLRRLSAKEKARNPFGNPDIDPRAVTAPEGAVTGAGLVHTELKMVPFAHRRDGKNKPKEGRSLDRPSYALDGGGILLDGLNVGGASAADKPAYTIRAEGTQHSLAIWNGDGRTAVPIDYTKPAATICDQSKSPLSAPAPTIVGGHREGIGGEGGRAALARQGIYRRLTPAECAILQGFPRDYIFTGSKTAIYKQIGNAVPPPVARAIAAASLLGESR